MSATATDLSDRLEPVRHRAAEAAATATRRARAGARTARRRAVEGAELARERAAEVAEVVEPTRSELATRLGRLVRRLVALLAIVPSVLSRILSISAGAADVVAERARTVAHQVEPPRSTKRRRRLATAGWVAGGFAAGAAAGWVAHDLAARQRVEDEVADADRVADAQARADGFGPTVSREPDTIRLQP